MYNVLNVLYQFNDNYAQYAAVSMTSLLENNKEYNVRIYVFEENVSLQSQEKIKKIADRYNSELFFVNTDFIISYMKHLGIPKYRSSYATNLKIFFNSALSADIGRILYIDSDTLVVGKLYDLFNTDMQGQPVGMVLDSLGDCHAKLIGLSKRDFYFNGGLMLIDIASWNAHKCTERITEYAKKIRPHFISPDQDLINLVLKGEIYLLDPRYNLQPIHKVYSPELYSFFWRWGNYYSNETIREAVEHPVIHHGFRYLGQFAWHKDSLHPDAALFDQYAELTCWDGLERKQTDKNTRIFRFERFLYKILPQPLFLFIFRISYNRFIRTANRESLQYQCSKNM